MGRAEDLFDRLERGGIAYLDELIETHKSEEAFLDFKRSENNGQSATLANSDLNNLSKALAGFANSDGGVVFGGSQRAASGHRAERIPQAEKHLLRTALHLPQRSTTLCLVAQIRQC